MSELFDINDMTEKVLKVALNEIKNQVVEIHVLRQKVANPDPYYKNRFNDLVKSLKNIHDKLDTDDLAEGISKQDLREHVANIIKHCTPKP